MQIPARRNYGDSQWPEMLDRQENKVLTGDRAHTKGQDSRHNLRMLRNERVGTEEISTEEAKRD